MLEVSHHEAVSVLRNAGSCIKMKVLRERCVSMEPRANDRSDSMETDPQISQECDVPVSNNRSGGPQSSTDPMPDCIPMTNRTEASACNGNGPVGWSEENIKRESLGNSIIFHRGIKAMKLSEMELVYTFTRQRYA